MPSNISDATGYGASTQFDAGVPTLIDTANIIDAFKYYHYGPDFNGTTNLGGIESHLRSISASVGSVNTQLFITTNDLNKLSASVVSSSTILSASVENVVVYQSSSPSIPYAGQLWIDSDDNKTYVYTGSSWSAVSGSSAGAVGGGNDTVFFENGNTVTTNYTISTNKNAVSAGPITINDGVTVTIPSGSYWVVV